MTATTFESPAPESTRPYRRGQRAMPGRVVAVLVAVAGLLGLGLVAGSPAQAAAGVTYQKVCATSQYAGTATPTITSYWWNGARWVAQGSARGSCVNFTLVHNGYWYYQATTTMAAPCVTYFWNYISASAFIKQNLPASSSITIVMKYSGARSTC